MSAKVPSVVIIGGGTGTYTVLTALRDKNMDLTALLTMVDDGGSNRILRDEFGLLPTSGVRLAMVALSRNRTLLRELFMYRFHQGNGISGMTFGNLFLAAVADIVGDQEKAIEETCKLLSVSGKILPISLDNVRLVAKYEDGSEIVGEHLIDEPEHDGTKKIVGVYTTPEAVISENSKRAIESADYILIGPGDFYTNTIPDMIVKGAPEAILSSKAKVVFIGNLMTKYGDSIGYTQKTFLDVLSNYIPLERITHVILNNDTQYPEGALAVYEKEHSIPIVDDLDYANLPSTTQVVRVPVLSHVKAMPQKGDVIRRSIIRHDAQRLGEELERIILQSH